MNYYNEHDPTAIAWLGEITPAIPIRMVDNACDQSVHDMLGKEPTPFQAIVSLLFDVHSR